jgi:hypothetical protein
MKRGPVPFGLCLSKAVFVLSALLFLGCHRPEKPAAPALPPPAEVLKQISESGPVKATVTLHPKKPRLGDPLTLTLTVDAKPGVRVEMPPFGDALGRFSISSFTPRSGSTADGGSQHSQRYVLEAPMSGRQRIPALRIEFSDERPGMIPDGGADSSRELLTDEISIDIASVLPDEANKSELRGLRGPLEESFGTRRAVRYTLPIVALLCAAGAYLFIRRLQQRARQKVRVTAYDMAMQRLAQLQARGWPGDEQIDAFYVELSDIVRRYIEDRYGVRAPELTTEEFLRAAHNELRLTQPQRELLEAFLSTCDRVKFAGYRPGEFESRQAFGEASRFLQDTRLPGGAISAEAQP